MQIKKIILQNFRCFKTFELDLNCQHILLQGKNGSGKTSLFEAIHYLCYLRSFRSYFSKDLLQFGQNHFFVKALYSNEIGNHSIQVGASVKKRLVKIDGQHVSFYREVMDSYRVVTMTEDDLFIIKGGPETRRSFIDQTIVLNDPNFLAIIKEFRSILSNRNSLLKNGEEKNDLYELWTKQLWDISSKIQNYRAKEISKLEHVINKLSADYMNENICISLSYVQKGRHSSFSELLASTSLRNNEFRYGRSLFGAHLDDIGISLNNKPSRLFISRGQQKLIIFLMRAAQLKLLAKSRGEGIFLIDDFITDFDEHRIKQLFFMLNHLKGQLIFAIPSHHALLEEWVKSKGGNRIFLSS